ncbi:hypothetical protein [Halorubrum sp. DM2]|uniref:hypothetical protein n=1 Tax=Halorubrum sp. DM2 TaxID=2527867 RepID=UPI0024B713E1|nr:hypothetical protein [Halorubrum sp. DM2]
MKNATPYHHRELEGLLEDLLEDLPGDFSDIGYVKELDCGRSCKLWNKISDSILTLNSSSKSYTPLPINSEIDATVSLFSGSVFESLSRAV